MPAQLNKYHILLLNGPNLNLLGLREPKQYGSLCLDKMIDLLEAKAKTIGCQLSHLQSNAEHVLIEKIHASQDNVDFILINPAAFTHTSVALRDALLAVKIPFIEIHLSNVYAREHFRHHSYFSDIAVGVIYGLGVNGYDCALQAAVNHLSASFASINRV